MKSLIYNVDTAWAFMMCLLFIEYWSQNRWWIWGPVSFFKISELGHKIFALNLSLLPIAVLRCCSWHTVNCIYHINSRMEFWKNLKIQCSNILNTLNIAALKDNLLLKCCILLTSVVKNAKLQKTVNITVNVLLFMMPFYHWNCLSQLQYFHCRIHCKLLCKS